MHVWRRKGAIQATAFEQNNILKSIYKISKINVINEINKQILFYYFYLGLSKTCTLKRCRWQYQFTEFFACTLQLALKSVIWVICDNSEKHSGNKATYPQLPLYSNFPWFNCIDRSDVWKLSATIWQPAFQNICRNARDNATDKITCRTTYYA